MKTQILLTLLGLCYGTQAQNLVSPSIQGYGAIYEVPLAKAFPNPRQSYRIVLDLKSGPLLPGQINPALNNIARMINLHHIAGVTRDKLEIIGVFHSLATPTVLSSEAYQKKYGMANPNIELIQSLKEAGVKFYVCGQSLIAQNFPFSDLNPDIVLSISALTVFTGYQAKGFNLLQF